MSAGVTGRVSRHNVARWNRCICHHAWRAAVTDATMGLLISTRTAMRFATSICTIVLTGLLASLAPAQAFDDAIYPDFSGQWLRINPGLGGQPTFDPAKPWGFAQQAPLTREYEAILEASIADQANGGQGNWNSGSRCLPPGMPATMNGYNSLELVVLPDITYGIVEHNVPINRRIYTDGREWPQGLDPTFQGYSIGKWIDSDGDGRFDVLEVETRYFKGPRAYDEAGLPLHFDNQSVFRERIYRDKTDPNILHDEITTIDHALTRPWIVDKKYVRDSNPRPVWPEYYIAEGNGQIAIGKENYFLSGDGVLMPAKKNQAPPDLRYFKPVSR